MPNEWIKAMKIEVWVLIRMLEKAQHMEENTEGSGHALPINNFEFQSSFSSPIYFFLVITKWVHQEFLNRGHIRHSIIFPLYSILFLF
jgi:hypothetical protein